MTSIRLSEAASGRVFLCTQQPSENVASPVLRQALIYAAARELFVPSLWIVLVGPSRRNSILDFQVIARAPDDATFHHYVCDLDGCVNCGDTTEAAGQECGWTEDERACHRCNPLRLCDRCRVCVDGEKHCCLACLEENELASLSRMQQKRLQALKALWADASYEADRPECVMAPCGRNPRRFCGANSS